MDLQAQPLEEALTHWAELVGLNISFDTPIPVEIKAPALHDDLTPEDAFARLVNGRRLRAVRVDERTVRIVQEPEPIQAQSIGAVTGGKTQGDRSGDRDDTSVESPQEKEHFKEITVTGSYIRDVDTLTPVVTLTRSEIMDRGYTSLDQVFDQMPQGFAGVSKYSNPIVGNSPGAVYNQTFASTVDLRGLGPGTTLVLLNGFRLPSAVVGRSVDIAAIPLSAVDRVEVTTDGASAIYGSDALGGVVNILTAKIFTGTEATARSDGISGGKAANYAGTILRGFDWSSGSAFVTVGYEKDNPLYAGTRSFTGTATGPTSLLPEQRITNAYARAQEKWSEKLSQMIDVLASVRRYSAFDSVYGYSTALHGSALQVDVVHQFEYKISPVNTISLVAQLPIERDVATTAYPSRDSANVDHYVNQAPSVESHIYGTPFKISGGDVRIALGVAFRRERFEWESSYAPRVSGQRRVGSAFGEILVPVVARTSQRPLRQELTVDLTARYDRYSDFGKSANPKISVLWKNSDQLSIHASYAKSFRAPTLYELYAPPFAGIVQSPSPASSTGQVNTLLVDGGNTTLTPEHARSVGIGFSYRPESIPGLGLEVSDVDIKYTDRIDQLSQEGFAATQVIEEAASLGGLVRLAPTKFQIEQVLRTPGLNLLAPVDVNDVGAIAYVGYANVGSSSVRALDAIVRYRQDPPVDGFTAEFWSSYFQKYVNQLTQQSPGTSVVGTAYHPTRFRMKLDIGWVQGSWSADGRLNYTSSYHNAGDPACPVAPGCAVSDWVTVDASLAYSSPPGSQSPLDGMRLELGIKNLFDRNPPFFRGGHGLNFDPANANPAGRMLAIVLTKRLGGK
jgi:outer membrane receptor protein involved in Fe transport